MRGMASIPPQCHTALFPTKIGRFTMWWVWKGKLAVWWFLALSHVQPLTVSKVCTNSVKVNPNSSYGNQIVQWCVCVCAEPYAVPPQALGCKDLHDEFAQLSDLRMWLYWVHRLWLLDVISILKIGCHTSTQGWNSQKICMFGCSEGQDAGFLNVEEATRAFRAKKWFLLVL